MTTATNAAERTTYPTMLSNFIAQLQEVLATDGDMPVTALSPLGEFRTSRVYIDVLPYYYDGGYLLPLDGSGYHCRHWIRSRTDRPNAPTTQHTRFVKIMAGAPERSFVHEEGERDTIDGEAVPDYSEDED